MSYEIYKSIKQNNDGTFDCVCASSNLFNQNGGYVWSNYHMTWFAEKFPSADKELMKAIWALYSTFNGDKFYQKFWKDLQALASEYMESYGVDYQRFYTDDNYWIDNARQFLFFLKNYKASMKKYVVALTPNRYVKRKNKSSCTMIDSISSAKVFKTTLEHLKNEFKYYSNYDVQFIEVK